MNVNDLKGRLAEALVESIFRRAGYRVARVGRESQVQGLVKVGSAEFAPDFLVWKQVATAGLDANLHRLLPIEVKYRSNLPDFLRKQIEPLAARVRDQWPHLHCIVITDTPDEGRSCFQVIEISNYVAGTTPLLLDLWDLRELDIFKTTVQEYEGLVKAIFSLLNSYASD